MSYSEDGQMPAGDLYELLSEYGRVERWEFPLNRYRSNFGRAVRASCRAPLLPEKELNVTLVGIDSIWYRTVQVGEFFNIERHPRTIPGGGGARYIEIPTTMVEDTLTFLGLSAVPGEELPEATISARVIGDPTVVGELEFKRKAGGRLRIANQNRQATPEARHPAWRFDRGFPKAADDVGSSEEAGKYYPDSIHLFLVLGADGDYYAGFTTGTQYPETWPDDTRLHGLFSDPLGGLISMSKSQPGEIDPLIRQIFDAWGRGKAALLYGPPGTGKTRVLSQLHAILNSHTESVELVLNTENAGNPFASAGLDLPIPKPVVSEWITFHQDYSYEDFVLGLRPTYIDDGLMLQPRLGRLLDLAYQVSVSKSAGSAVIFIDEVNRGNAAGYLVSS